MRKLLITALAAATLAGAAGAADAQTVVVERYGPWDSGWGPPPPPPRASWRHWRGHERNWHSHVHQCMIRFKTYDPYRDMYRIHKRWVACRD